MHFPCSEIHGFFASTHAAHSETGSGLPDFGASGYNRCLGAEVFAIMKAATHPNYSEVRVQCACGHSFLTRSTHHGDIHVEICSNCHPFFTGKQREIDTAGRIERFRRKYANVEKKVEKK
jgi:large subunit ribosomal protein L31